MEFKTLAELFKFIRVKLCIFSIFISLTGYLIFNNTSNLFFIVVTSFFLSAGTCAYNNVTDVEEDSVNKGVNMFANNGLFIASICFLLAFLSSFFLSTISFLFSISIMLTSITYSFFKIKKYLLVKNLYSAFGTPQLFLLGAGYFGFSILFYYIIMSLFFFSGSLIADMRDYAGDKLTGIRTLPVRISYERTKYIVCLSLILFLVMVLQTDLFPMSVFIILMLISLLKEKIKTAHSLGGISLIFLDGWLLIW